MIVVHVPQDPPKLAYWTERERTPGATEAGMDKEAADDHHDPEESYGPPKTNPDIGQREEKQDQKEHNIQPEAKNH